MAAITTTHTNLKPGFKLNNTRYLSQYLIEKGNSDKRNIVTSAWIKRSSTDTEPVLLYDIVPHIQAIVLPIETLYVATQYPSNSSTIPTNYNVTSTYSQCSMYIGVYQPKIYSGFTNYNTSIAISGGTGYGGSVISSYPRLLLDNGLLLSYSFINLVGSVPGYSYSLTMGVDLTAYSGYNNAYQDSCFGYQVTNVQFSNSYSTTKTWTNESAVGIVGDHLLHVGAYGPSQFTQLIIQGLTIAGKRIPVIIGNNCLCYPTDKQFLLDKYIHFSFPAGTTWGSWISNISYINGTSNPFKSNYFEARQINGEANVIVYTNSPFPTNGDLSVVYSDQGCTNKVHHTDTILANHEYFTVPFNANNWRTNSIFTT